MAARNACAAASMASAGTPSGYRACRRVVFRRPVGKRGLELLGGLDMRKRRQVNRRCDQVVIPAAARQCGGHMLERLVYVGEGSICPPKATVPALRAALASVSVEVSVAISSRALALVCAGVSA